jgi:membrane protein DedA with SNARE-associated domain
VNRIGDWATTFVQNYGLLAIFITMVLESAFVPIPSEVVVPLGGVLAAQGHVALWQVVVVATVANLVGSLIIYAIGYYGGRRLVVRYGRYVRLKEHHLATADSWFERRGALAVFVTRMLPGVRSLISLPAGVSRMPIGSFSLYTTLGSIPWNLALAYLGYLFGENWTQLEQYLRRGDLIIIGLAVCVVLVLLALASWHRRRTRVSTSR